jgi:heterodisulfide reductase subunit A
MDAERPYCSRVCCSQALKNACELKRQNPDMDVVVCYRELMSYGLMETYYTDAREQGVVFVRYDPGSPPEVTADGDQLIVSAKDTSLGGLLELSPDVLVLSTGMIPRDNSMFAQSLGVPLTESGFFGEAEPKFRPVDLHADGVFVCGLAHSPRAMSETIIQAQAAAGRACQFLERSGIQTSDDVAVVTSQWCSGCELCVQACPYGARIVDPETGTASVVAVQCRGCGACVAVCPNKASSLRRSSARQVLSVLDAALGVR